MAVSIATQDSQLPLSPCQRDYNQLVFSLDAPVGHLPVRVLWDIGNEFLCIDGERDRDYATAHAMDGLMLMSALFENPRSLD